MQHMARRSVGKLNSQSSALFLCDIQTRFQPLIHQMPSVIHCANTLLHVAEMLQLPTVATEQYAKAFGPLVPHFNGHLDKRQAGTEIPEPTEEDQPLIAKLANPPDWTPSHRVPVFPKTQFSMLTEDVHKSIQQQQENRTDVQGKKQIQSVILLGIEVSRLRTDGRESEWIWWMGIGIQ